MEIDRAKIVTERYESTRGEILKRAGNQGNISGQNIETVKNVTEIKNILGEVILGFDRPKLQDALKKNNLMNE